MKIFSKDNKYGRTVRTFLQAIIGICVFVLGLLAIPGVQSFLSDNQVASVTTLAFVIAVTTYVYNSAEQLIHWLFGDGE